MARWPSTKYFTNQLQCCKRTARRREQYKSFQMLILTSTSLCNTSICFSLSPSGCLYCIKLLFYISIEEVVGCGVIFVDVFILVDCHNSLCVAVLREPLLFGSVLHSQAQKGWVSYGSAYGLLLEWLSYFPWLHTLASDYLFGLLVWSFFLGQGGFWFLVSFFSFLSASGTAFVQLDANNSS